MEAYKEKNTTGLLVACRDSRMVCHVIKLEGPDRKVRNFSSSSYDAELELADLTIEAFVNPEHADLGASYGWSIEYIDAYVVNLRRAESMAKQLRTIGKRMDKSAAQYGRPATFGQYVAHAARAIGATAIVFERKRNGGSSYDDNDYGYSSIADGAREIDHLVATKLAEGKVAA